MSSATQNKTATRKGFNNRLEFSQPEPSSPLVWIDAVSERPKFGQESREDDIIITWSILFKWDAHGDSFLLVQSSVGGRGGD